MAEANAGSEVVIHSCEYCGRPGLEGKRFCDEVCYRHYNNRIAEKPSMICIPFDRDEFWVSARGEAVQDLWVLYEMERERNPDARLEDYVKTVLWYGVNMWAHYVGQRALEPLENIPGEAADLGARPSSPHDWDFVRLIVDQVSKAYLIPQLNALLLVWGTGLENLVMCRDIKPIKREFEYRRTPIASAESVLEFLRRSGREVQNLDGDGTCGANCAKMGSGEKGDGCGCCA